MRITLGLSFVGWPYRLLSSALFCSLLLCLIEDVKMALPFVAMSPTTFDVTNLTSITSMPQGYICRQIEFDD